MNTYTQPYCFENGQIEKRMVSPKRFDQMLNVSQLDFSVHEHQMLLDRLTLHLSAEVASMHIENYTFRAPADWVEAIKERWFPEWAKKKWPVKWREEKIEAEALLPDFALPDRMRFIPLYSVKA